MYGCVCACYKKGDKARGDAIYIYLGIYELDFAYIDNCLFYSITKSTVAKRIFTTPSCSSFTLCRSSKACKIYTFQYRFVLVKGVYCVCITTVVCCYSETHI